MDLRLDVTWPDHPKIRALEDRLGEGAVLALLRLWTWARLHAPAGEIPPCSAEDLARYARWPGDPDTFRLALLSSCPGKKRGLLTSTTYGGLRLVGWEERQPFAVEEASRSRSTASARSEAARKAGKASAAARAAKGWSRDPASGLFAGPPHPNGSPNGSTERHPNGRSATRSERPPSQPLVNPNDSPNEPNVSDLPIRTPPPPTTRISPSATRPQSGSRLAARLDDQGPRHAPAGSWFQAEADRVRALQTRLLDKRSREPLGPRDERALADAEAFLARHDKETPR